MSKKIDMIGEKFGRLLVIEESEPIYSRSNQKIYMWKCLCDCGNTKIVRGSHLRCGNIKSCGCLRSDLARLSHIKNNTYDLSGDYGIGYDSKGNEFWFDKEDYDLIKDYCWRKRNDNYFDAKVRDGTDKRILLHTLIMNQKYIDHINGSASVHDNRKNNLRIMPQNYSFDTYNQMNKKVQRNNKSGVPGVIWHKRDCVWNAYISINKKRISLGYFDNFKDAVRARKDAEEKYFGEYSYDNSQLVFSKNDLKKEEKITNE